MIKTIKTMETILITGATDGIGREAARQLLTLGHRILAHGRTLESASNAAAELSEDGSRGSIEPVFGDLSVMSNVLDLAEQVKTRTQTLDVLINNAGVYEPQRRITPDGFETTMAVNHFAHFLLTRQLLDAVKAAPGGRVITVSSSAHHNGKLDPMDRSFAVGMEGYQAYAASKLANVLFTTALSQRLSDTSVTANSLDPGVITTKLLRIGWGTTGAPVADGAKTYIYLATAGEVSKISGEYFVDCRRATMSPVGQDIRIAEALWQATEELLLPLGRPAAA